MGYLERGSAVGLAVIDSVDADGAAVETEDVEAGHVCTPSSTSCNPASLQAQIYACSNIDGYDVACQGKASNGVARQQGQQEHHAGRLHLATNSSTHAPSKPVNLIAQYRQGQQPKSEEGTAAVRVASPAASRSPVLLPAQPSCEDIPEEISLALTSIHSGMMYSEASLHRVPSTRDTMMQRRFNEDDPFQVLDESLIVLGEIEVLIKDSLNLSPDAPLGQQGEGVLAQVPSDLLDALQETISVILESRSEIDEIMSHCSTSSSRARTPSSSIAHNRRHHAHETQQRKAATTPAKANNLSPYLQRTVPSGSPMERVNTPGSCGMSNWDSSRAQNSPQTPSRGAAGRVRLHGGRLGSGGGLGGEHSSMSQGSGASGASVYMYQRVQAQRLQQEQQQRQHALEEHRRQLDAEHNSKPAAEFIAKQNARQAEAERKRIAQMRADLQFIEKLRGKQAMMEQHHAQALEQAEQYIATLRSMKTKTDVTRKWLAYQDALGAH